MAKEARNRRGEQRRYRKVSLCMHADDKFCELSKPQPNGQSLWLYLIAGPRTTNLPGLFRVHLSEIATHFGWKPRALRRVLDEIVSRSMALHDEKACVFFLPHAINHNEPQSANVIKSWRAAFDEVPPSPLKAVALSTWRAYLEQATLGGLDKSFLDAFTHAFPEGIPQGIPNALPRAKNTGPADQEQKIEYEQESTYRKNGGAGAPRSPGPVENSAPEPDETDLPDPPDGEDDSARDGDGDSPVEPPPLGPDGHLVLPATPFFPTPAAPAPKTRTIAAVIRLDNLPVETSDDVTEADLEEVAKSACARHGVPYNSTTVGKALESERFKQRQGLRRGS